MTHTEAVTEMKTLADSRDWSLTHKTSSYTETEIYGYIAGMGRKGFGHALCSTTYAGAIKNVKKMLELAPEEIDGPPEDETT